MKTKLSQKQKDYFLNVYMENELAICLSFDKEDRLKYLGVIEDDEIEKVLYEQVNESVNYIEDVIEGYDDMYIECLNPNIEGQEDIVIIDDSKEKLKFLNVEKEKLLKYVDEDYINFEIRGWEYTFKDSHYRFGRLYSFDNKLKEAVSKILN